MLQPAAGCPHQHVGELCHVDFGGAIRLASLDSDIDPVMVYSRTILLRAAQNPSRRIKLTYRSNALVSSQARLRGRFSLSPVIDLNDYGCRAVIDWVQITFSLGRPTQFRYLQAELENLVGKKLFVDPQLPDAGEVSSVFTVSFYDPNLALVRACREVVRMKFGESDEPFIDLVEVSVDFRPRIPSDESRGRMVAVLARQLYTDRNILARESTSPRFSWGARWSQNKRTLALSPWEEDDGNFYLNTTGDKSPPVDATYYLGHREIGPLWRVMDKVIDRQNRAAKTRIDLAEDEKRARVEVRLDRLELKRLGVTSMDALMHFNFAQLQRTYFKFMLSTFIDSNAVVGPADRYWEQARMDRFLTTGVIGLRGMDEQRSMHRALNRKVLVSSQRIKGKAGPQRSRTGLGASGTSVAYELLNRRVAMALEKLTDRERKMLMLARRLERQLSGNRKLPSDGRNGAFALSSSLFGTSD